MEKRFVDGKDVLDLLGIGLNDTEIQAFGITQQAINSYRGLKAKGKGIQKKDMVVPNSAPPTTPGKTRDEIAKVAGVGHDTHSTPYRQKMEPQCETPLWENSIFVRVYFFCFRQPRYP